jgi:hypothetical protein
MGRRLVWPARKEAPAVTRPSPIRLLAVLGVAAATLSAQPAPDSTALVYADFEKMEGNSPVSARGGVIQMYAYEESGVHKSTFKGPELVHIKKDDPNRALKFDYSLRAPNQWAGVVVEIHGLPDVDGKMVPDDASGFKTLSLQVYATGIEILRLEAISKGRGKDMGMVYPLMTFKVRPGFNTYKVPLKGFTQPAWASVRIDPKEVFKSLTSIKLTAFCDQCERNQDGVVIVDNLVFEK